MDNKSENVTNSSEIIFKVDQKQMGYYPNLSVIMERSESKEEKCMTFEEAMKVIGKFQNSSM